MNYAMQVEPRSMLTTEKDIVQPNCNTKDSNVPKASKATKNLFNDKQANGTAAKFISSSNLINKTRATTKKRQVHNWNCAFIMPLIFCIANSEVFQTLGDVEQFDFDIS